MAMKIFVLLTFLFSVSNAFVNQGLERSFNFKAPKLSSTTLRAAIDPLDAVTQLQHSQEWLNQATAVLADGGFSFSLPSFGGGAKEAVDAAAVVQEVVNDPSWWDRWQTFVEDGLKLLHSQLNSLGINSWGVTIAIFTLSVKFLLFPLNYQQQESAQKMQLITPATQKLKERIKNPDTLNQMTALMYEQTQVNPLAGCIPSFIQIPVFIALYRSILSLSVENLLGEPFLFLPSLAGPVYGERGLSWLTEALAHPEAPPLGSWEATLPYLVIPIVLVISQRATMAILSPPMENPDPASERIQAVLKYLPFMIGYFSLQVPSALCIYWFVNNVFTTVQSLSLKKWFEANPPELDFGQFKDILEKDAPIPQTFEEAMYEASLHELPPRAPRRPAAP
mmetsp:Transcript_14106/g.21424  ORF Transcript_14106/g.21424 Transcript_14106/m.21424 type:complete len:393 (-) Transcript_14106:235-1413(-)